MYSYISDKQYDYQEALHMCCGDETHLAGHKSDPSDPDCLGHQTHFEGFDCII